MTRDQIVDVCRRAPKVGSVAHEEFAEYVVALQHRRRGEEGWTNVEHAYMTVDGKLSMANEDHRRQGKRLDFGPLQVLVDSDEQLTLLVTITSEMYGVRHGVATSRRIGGSEIERLFPWEVAETSAIGRALSAMGYGVFPGSGLASAEDMIRSNSMLERANAAEPEAPRAPRTVPTQPTAASSSQPGANSPARSGQGPSRNHPPLSPVQRRKLTELYRSLHGGAGGVNLNEGEALSGLEKLFVESFRHGMNEATYEEGARITAQLLSELRNKTAAG